MTKFLLSSPQDQKAETMALHLYLDNIRESIKKDEFAAALQQLHALLENSPKLNEIIQQMGRFSDIRQQMRLGTLSFENATLTKNQIRFGLLDLLEEIEKEGVKTAIQEEAERATQIQNSKNVVLNSSINAGGDVHIGDKSTTQNAEKIYNIDKIDNANFS